MNMFRGRPISVDGHSYLWRLCRAGGRLVGSSGKTATLVVQSSEAHGALLRASLTSRKWTAEMDLDEGRQMEHHVSFSPADAAKAIRVAIAAGWKPTEKGQECGLPAGVDFTEYRS